MAQRSPILAIQDILFKQSDPSQNIISSIGRNEDIIRASNVSDEASQLLQVVVNQPVYNNSYLFLSDVKVYIDNSLYPTPIYGLYEILSKQVAISDVANGFLTGAKFHTPFAPENFSNPNVYSIGDLVDILSTQTPAIANTEGKSKKYMFVFDSRGATRAPSTTDGTYLTYDGRRSDLVTKDKFNRI